MAIDSERILPCPGIELFLDSHDDLYLLPIAERDQLCISAPMGRWVFRLLRGESVDDMPLELSDELARALDWLADDGFVRRESTLRSDDTEHWDRQVQWFGQETGDGPARQRRLAEACVVVLGVGGLGCTVADQLARAGVGTLVLVDDDVVEASNLPRQQLFTTSHVGRLKVDAAAERLLAAAPSLRVERCASAIGGAADMAQIVAAHDPQLVVCAADRPPIAIKTWVEDAAAAYGVAVMHGGHRPPFSFAGPFFVPGRSACYECYARSRVAAGTERLEAEITAWRDVDCPQLPAVGWGDGVTASMLVAQSVQWLAGIADPVLLGREFELDMRTLATRFVEGPGSPQCERCNGARTVSSHG